MEKWRERYFLRKQEVVRTTWTFRVLVTACLLILLAVTRSFWLPGVAEGLVCQSEIRPSDAILVDNFEINYVVFERAAELQSSGIAPRVLIPTAASGDPVQLNRVSMGIAELMVQISRLPQPELVPVREIEPVALNAAYQIRDLLAKNHIRSVIVVTPAFRSRRSSMVYETIFGESGIKTFCDPVFGELRIETWTNTLHGIQQVLVQQSKLQYYRFFVMPYLHWQRVSS